MQELANSIQRGSLDWERAMRCIRHAIRTTPSPDWWKRVLLVAPSYRSPAQGPTPGAVFTSEMICEAVIDRIAELLKLTNSGNNLFHIFICYSFDFVHMESIQRWLNGFFICFLLLFYPSQTYSAFM